MNNIVISGNVGQEPVLRYAQSGKAILKFSIADSYGKDEKENTTWHNIVVFDEQAENVADKIQKGSRVIVWGRLQSNQYTDKEGNQKTAFEVVANEVALSLRWKPKGAQGGNAVSRREVVEEDPF